MSKDYLFLKTECRRCGKEFITDDMRVKYCPQCMKLPKGVRYYNRAKQSERPCVVCGKETTRRLYCSAACARAAAKVRGQVEKHCKHCGKAFVNEPRVEYCSDGCRWIYKKTKHTCVTCGDTFYGGNNSKYCSRRCRPPQYKRKACNSTCEACKRPFMANSKRVLYCHQEGCISHGFRGNAKITKTYKVDGAVDKRKACAAVVCSKVDEVGNVLFTAFSTMNVEPYLSAFKQIKNRFLTSVMGDYIHRVAVGAALFYIVLKKEVSKANVIRVIRNQMRVHLTEVTMSKYITRIESDGETCKLVDALQKPDIKIIHDTSENEAGITVSQSPKKVDGVFIMTHSYTEFHHVFPGAHGSVLAYNWSYRVYCKACNKLIGNKKKGMAHVLAVHKDLIKNGGKE